MTETPDRAQPLDRVVPPQVMAAAALVEAGCPHCFMPLADHDPADPDPCPLQADPDPVVQLALRAARDADRPVMDDIVEHLDGRRRPSGRGGPVVSDYGRCPRAVWYRETPPDGYSPAPVDRRRAALGTVVHAAAETARRLRYPWRLYETPVPIPGLDRYGRFDEYDPVTGEITDDKTTADYGWALVGDDGPDGHAWGQVQIYGLALEELGWPVRTVRVITIHRDTGEEEHFRRPYDPAAGRVALDELIDLAVQLDLGMVPPRAGTGPGTFPCSWCPARMHCWNVDTAQAVGRSPESYTILGPNPDEPIIAWAAWQAYHVTKARAAAEKAAKVAAALLEGIPAGTYTGDGGAIEVVDRGRRMPEYKDAYLQAEQLWELPDGLRPVQLPPPPRRRDQWKEAKPVRAAKRSKGKAADV